jgi:hypothetical protein
MKQINSSGKNIAILAFGATTVGSIIFYFGSKAVSKTYPNAYPKISYYLHRDSFKVKESSLKLIGPIVDIKLLHLNIKGSSKFNALMKFFFTETAAFKYFLQQKSDMLAKQDIITTSSDNPEQLDLLRELDFLLHESTGIVYPTMGGKNQIVNSFAKAINLVVTSPEKHNKESIVQFLQNVSATKTASKIANILNKAEELKIFSAALKALEQLSGPADLQEFVTILVPEDKCQKDKLVLFTKLIHSLGHVNLDLIWDILKCKEQETIIDFALYESKDNLEKLYQVYESDTHNIKAEIDAIVSQKDESKTFNLVLDGPNLYDPVWVGIKSEGLKAIIGAEFDIAKADMSLGGLVESLASSDH